MIIDKMSLDVPLIIAGTIVSLTVFVLCRIAYLTWKEKRSKQPLSKIE